MHRAFSRRLLPGCLALLAFLSLATAADAQTGKLAGRILDATTGEPLFGATVFVLDTERGASADLDGYYSVIGLRPGTYSVRVSLIGYGTTVIENVRMQINQTTRLDAELASETVETEEVVVRAERPIVQRDLTSSATSVSSEELASLPVQSFSDVVNLQAGVVEGHFRGGRTGEVAYLVDGVPVNDAYDQSFAFQVENEAIQEIEVISGTFNAEYGQAQSGVVNIVTKDGSDDYRMNLSGYGGGYATGASGLFDRPSAFSPVGNVEANGSLSGPVPGLGSRLTFFGSGRYVRNEGYLYGRRVVQPVYAGTDARQPVELEDRTVFVPALGDSSMSSLNWSEQATAQLKLTSSVLGGRLGINGLVQRDRGQNYDHLFRYNPDGQTTVYGTSASVIGTFTRLLSSTTFLDLKGAVFTNAVDEYVYEDPLDPRYPRDTALRELRPNFSFYLGGARPTQFARETRTGVVRADLTSQINRRHLVKGGAELKLYSLSLSRFDVLNNASTGFEPAIPPAGTPAHVTYDQTPIEASAYLQDKMEFEYLVINAGVRVDYFDARTTVPSDFTRPTTSDRVPAEAKVQVSPRLGLAYPISEAGVIHVAYGHFFQMPPFDFLFTNPDYIYDPEQGLGRPFGYADLEPQQTTAYEIGLQQGFSRTIGLTATLYSKDIRNLLGTRIETIGAGVGENFQLSRYGRYVNRDYGNVRGVTLAFERRPTDGFGLNVDYTFQIAEGNASDPRDRLLAEQAGNEPTKQLVPLEWDRRHQLNVRAAIGRADRSFGLVSLVAQLGSGLPYTPTQADQRTGVENSARRPGEATVDLFATRRVSIGGLQPGLFLRVYNLLDARNVRNVYTDTGLPTPNLRYYSGAALGLNTKDEFLERPDFYVAPRLVQIGASLDL